MNIVAETVIHDVADPSHSVRHAVGRDMPLTGSVPDESDYWMCLSIRYGHGATVCLLSAVALSDVGTTAGIMVSILILIPLALLGVLLVAMGLWCHGNPLDARDLSMWSMGTHIEEVGKQR